MKAKLKFMLIFSLIIICSKKSISQEKFSAEKNAPRDFAIPASPLFDLPGVAPSQVSRTAEIRDLKVDRDFKSWKLSPNRALQGRWCGNCFIRAALISDELRHAPNYYPAGKFRIFIPNRQSQLPDTIVTNTHLLQ